jgi:hypothetical protein
MPKIKLNKQQRQKFVLIDIAKEAFHGSRDGLNFVENEYKEFELMLWRKIAGRQYDPERLRDALWDYNNTDLIAEAVVELWPSRSKSSS